MIELGGQVGELRFKVEVTRAETGKVEEYDLIGYLDEQQLKEIQDGSNSQHSGT